MIPQCKRIVDNLTSESTKDSLSANQGRVLSEKIEGKLDKTTEIIGTIAGGSSYEWILSQNKGCLVHLFATGSNRDCGILYYVFRRSQYFGNVVKLATINYSTTGDYYTISTSNTTTGTKFTISVTGNNSMMWVANIINFNS